MAHQGRTPHVGCALSLIEICAALFGGMMQYDPLNPQAPDRDLLVLSKGHGVMALYACCQALGWLSAQELGAYMANGSRLRGVCEVGIPGCEVTSGSLGHGLPVATGMALGLQRLASPRRVWCIVGDGEMNEGSIWEALLLAAHQNLGHLTLIVDANGHQALGRTEEVLRLEPLAARLTAFGWEALECDGHDLAALRQALAPSRGLGGPPRAVVARTIKGCGISFLADDNQSHYARFDQESLAVALRELG